MTAKDRFDSHDRCGEKEIILSILAFHTYRYEMKRNGDISISKINYLSRNHQFDKQGPSMRLQKPVATIAEMVQLQWKPSHLLL